MYTLAQTNKFKKDIKLAKKRGLDMKLLDNVVTTLLENNGKLPGKYKPHVLKGDTKDYGNVIYSPTGF